MDSQSCPPYGRKTCELKCVGPDLYECWDCGKKFSTTPTTLKEFTVTPMTREQLHDRLTKTLKGLL